MHLFGFDMDLPAELGNNFKHYFDNGTVTKWHDFYLMARAISPTLRVRRATAPSELILLTGECAAHTGSILQGAARGGFPQNLFSLPSGGRSHGMLLSPEEAGGRSLTQNWKSRLGF